EVALEAADDVAERLAVRVPRAIAAVLHEHALERARHVDARRGHLDRREIRRLELVQIDRAEASADERAEAAPRVGVDRALLVTPAPEAPRARLARHGGILHGHARTGPCTMRAVSAHSVEVAHAQAPLQRASIGARDPRGGALHRLRIRAAAAA